MEVKEYVLKIIYILYSSVVPTVGSAAVFCTSQSSVLVWRTFFFLGGCAES